MSRRADDLQHLVELELGRMPENVRRKLEHLLCKPTQITLKWDYSSVPTQVLCWLVAESEMKNVRLVYSDHGFGPSFPWGYVATAATSLGMDSQLHSGLLDAARVPPAGEPRHPGRDGRRSVFIIPLLASTRWPSRSRPVAYPPAGHSPPEVHRRAVCLRDPWG